MENSNSYVPLGDDLTEIVDGYQSNPMVTETQRDIWRREGRGKAITHGMLGKDHPDALRLLEADGYDGQPVGSLSRRSAESFWNYRDNHIFPPKVDLIRLGIFFHLDLYRMIALVLKGIWEKFFAREICEWRSNVGQELSEVLEREEKMEEAINRFNPDTESLYSLFLEQGNLDREDTQDPLVEETQKTGAIEDLVDEMKEKARRAGISWLAKAKYSPETFDTLVQEMLHNQIHWVGTNSPELDRFKEEKLEEVVIWHLGTEEDRQKYWRLTQARIQLLMDLDQIYLDIESQRLKNEEITYRYLDKFGEYEIALREAKFRYSMLEKKVMLKRQNPDFGEDELDEQVQEMIEEQKKELENKKKKTKWASGIDKEEVPIPGRTGKVGLGDKTAYINKCKKLLRDIHLLIHPDRLKNNSAYEDLTPEQKEELQGILKETLKIKPKEMTYPDTYLESRYRSPEALQDVLDRVKFILENAGINVDPGIKIQGETLPDRLSWLEEEIRRQEKYLQSAKAKLQALMTDDDISRKKGILDNEDRHQEIINEMKEKTEEYEQKTEELRSELEELLEDVPS